MSSLTVGQVRKAIGAAIAGGLAWGTMVVASAPSGITAWEWLALGTYASGVAAVFGLTNDTPPPTIPDQPNKAR